MPKKKELSGIARLPGVKTTRHKEKHLEMLLYKSKKLV